MSDPWVENVQDYLNDTYTGVTGWNPIEVTGRTGWPTMRALTRALQHELGITALSDTFGPSTVAALDAIGAIGPSTAHPKIAQIYNLLIGGLYAKGYNGGDGALPGSWSTQTETGVRAIQSNIGVAQTGTVTSKLFKAILNMDAYVLVGSGTSAIRQVQQWMNATYLSRSWFSIIPADGSYSRDVQKALVYAIQEQLAVAGANGNYGPGTRAAVASAPTVAVGSADSGASKLVRLFQAALRFNSYDADFNGTFSAADSTKVLAFQTFCLLPVTGESNYQTWSSLLVSNGDPDRVGEAADTITQVTAARAGALTAQGREVVGRYLTNVSGAGALNKKIQAGELTDIFAAGLRIFPIYQTTAASALYFSEPQGAIDARLAVDAAAGYGFGRATTIYFAVDFDATDDDIANRVLPHFRGIASMMHHLGDRYRIGVYGTRNVCRRVSEEGLAEFSFVAGMSTGYSGNLGYLLPENWAFDQISTVTVGSGASSIEIDNNIYSGRDAGQSSVTAPTGAAALDVGWDPTLTSALESDLQDYVDSLTEYDPPILPTYGGIPATVTAILYNDALVTSLARAWGIRKALIQAVAAWEYWRRNIADTASDTAVRNWYQYLEELEIWQQNPIGPPPVAPIPVTEDSSTGFAQIFAATAIAAHNWALANNFLTSGDALNTDSPTDMWQVWSSLADDVEYNLSAVPQVLMWGADDVGVSGPPRTNYTSTEIFDIIRRYNGSGSEAERYARAVVGFYDIFEGYNAGLR
ncbi:MULTISPECIES: glycoside hydrolase domain-containing protein [Micrococcales]|uniref:glycoside hydrolase domain-containing protein n=1 Tax=Micrococcales TaxID=85006 RepID=UPI0012E287FF|nr:MULTISPECIES: glycoside hydrolase domain-containing protein [Micrococcales]QOT23993.1 DUF1906 domain-containing protein [Paenarthrobacter sp. YJN-D]QOT24103.1 DUF1906 domain-containing protein [Paenarthrobacter sp. YJN-D]